MHTPLCPAVVCKNCGSRILKPHNYVATSNDLRSSKMQTGNYLQWSSLVLWCFVSLSFSAGITMSTVSAIRLECAGFLSAASASNLVGGCILTCSNHLWSSTCVQIALTTHPHMDPYGLSTCSLWWYEVKSDLYDMMISRFLKIGVSPNHPNFDRGFHEINHQAN